MILPSDLVQPEIQCLFIKQKFKVFALMKTKKNMISLNVFRWRGDEVNHL